MDHAIVNPDLESAAKRALTHFTGLEDSLKPLYLQPDRAVFLAEYLQVVLKVYVAGNVLRHEYEIAQKATSIGVPTPTMLGFEAGQPAVFAMKQVIGHPLSSHQMYAAQEAGTYLLRFHTLGAQPPFAGGQQHWDDFILWWVHDELEKVKRFEVFDHMQLIELQGIFDRLKSLLAQRPVVLLHGDLQSDHILVDSQTEKVLAFLDFADAQPGDPLWDIAVVTLWDIRLTDLLLAGYNSIEKNEETKQLLSLYRLLRHLTEIPWLLDRGFKKIAERNITALKDSLRAFPHY